MTSSILAKIRQAKTEHPAIQQPIPLARAPIPDSIKAVMPDPPPKTISRGRTRKAYTKAGYKMDNAKAVRIWAEARLVPNSHGACYVGSRHPVATHYTTTGKRVKLMVEYERLSLREDYLQFASKQGWPKPAMKHFSGTLVKVLLDLGWPASIERSHRQRRTIVRGVDIQGQPSWSGNEYSL